MNDRLNHWMFEAYRLDVRALAFIRMLYMGYCLLFLGMRLDGIALLPKSVFHPAPGMSNWLPAPVPQWFLIALSLLLLATAVGIGVGYRTQLASRLHALGLFVFMLIGQSLGKIDHSLLLVVFPLLMSWSGWGKAWSVDARNGSEEPRGEAWPLSMLALVVGFLWFSGACFKIMGGWLNPETCASCWHFQQNILGNERSPWVLFALESHAGMEWMDWTTVLFEGLFLPATVAVRAFRLWIWLALGFHLAVMLTMGIDFSAFGLVYLAFFAWEALPLKGKVNQGPPLGLGLGAFALLALGYAWKGALFNAVFGPAVYERGVFTLAFLFLLSGSLFAASLIKRGQK